MQGKLSPLYTVGKPFGEIYYTYVLVWILKKKIR